MRSAMHYVTLHLDQSTAVGDMCIDIICGAFFASLKDG